MFKKLTLTLAASAALLASHAFASELPEYKLVPEKSSLKFFAIQNNSPVQGEFTDFTASIHFDKDKLEESTVQVEVDMTKIKTVNKDVASYLAETDWLAPASFPKAVFTSSKFTRMPSSESYYAPGDLTLRGVRKPVVLNFQLENVDGKRVVAKGFVTLQRNEFGVGQGEWSSDELIKHEVRVEFRIVADKQ